MRLTDLIEKSRNLRDALDEFDSLGKPIRGNDIHVHAYIVHAHWRRRPLRRKKVAMRNRLTVIQGRVR